MIDLKVENSIDFKDFKNSSVKDTLFELIMLRLEYMFVILLNNVRIIFK